MFFGSGIRKHWVKPAGWIGGGRVGKVCFLGPSRVSAQSILTLLYPLRFGGRLPKLYKAKNKSIMGSLYKIILVMALLIEA